MDAHRQAAGGARDGLDAVDHGLGAPLEVHPAGGGGIVGGVAQGHSEQGVHVVHGVEGVNLGLGRRGGLHRDGQERGARESLTLHALHRRGQGDGRERTAVLESAVAYLFDPRAEVYCGQVRAAAEQVVVEAFQAGGQGDGRECLAVVERLVADGAEAGRQGQCAELSAVGEHASLDGCHAVGYGHRAEGVAIRKGETVDHFDMSGDVDGFQGRLGERVRFNRVKAQRDVHLFQRLAKPEGSEAQFAELVVERDGRQVVAVSESIHADAPQACRHGEGGESGVIEGVVAYRREPFGELGRRQGHAVGESAVADARHGWSEPEVGQVGSADLRLHVAPLIKAGKGSLVEHADAERQQGIAIVHTDRREARAPECVVADGGDAGRDADRREARAAVEGAFADRRDVPAEADRREACAAVETVVVDGRDVLADDEVAERGDAVERRAVALDNVVILQVTPEVDALQRAAAEEDAEVVLVAHVERHVGVLDREVGQRGATREGRVVDGGHAGADRHRLQRSASRERVFTYGGRAATRDVQCCEGSSRKGIFANLGDTFGNDNRR